MIDRIVVSKRQEPKRWDMIVFRFPEDSETNFVMRLVGLPGERVELRDGEVTIDGEIMPKPARLAFLRYDNLADGGGLPERWGVEGRPVTLGGDEYYVLGDFSTHARDSRLWEVGAEGHPPYAVPRDHLIGVVTYIYWPPSRMRTIECHGE